jgi:Xaa-Pro aminopeptidase
MQHREDRVRNLMKEKSVDAVIISDRYNVNYISGYMGDTGMLFFVGEAQYVLTDSRYTEIAGRQAEGFCCVDIGLDGYAKTVMRLLNEEIGQSLSESDVDKVVNVGFEDESISYRQYTAFCDEFNSDEAVVTYELSPLGTSVNELRMIKSEDEIRRIAAAEEIGDKAFKHIVSWLRPGMTEQEVALELEVAMRKLGATGLSFETISASGENSSMPHAVPTDRRLKAGDFLTIDFGCIYEGYCSDMTRTVFISVSSECGLKQPTEKQLEVYNTVLKAQLESMKLIKPGAVCSEVDACARRVIADAGYGDYFGHGLGHSVGLFIHEEPRFSRKCDTVLEPGMVITVEPGIYLPGEFGVRIEDLVVVTEDGYENLTYSTKELVEI